LLKFGVRTISFMPYPYEILCALSGKHALPATRFPFMIANEQIASEMLISKSQMLIGSLVRGLKSPPSGSEDLIVERRHPRANEVAPLVFP